MIYKYSFLTFTLFFLGNFCYSQLLSPKVGVFYFDGWTAFQWDNYKIKKYQAGAYNDLLVNEYGDREPFYGWVTSTSEGLKSQINDAKEAGISFFIFDWYYCQDTGYENCFLNNALKLFMQQAPSDFKFSTMLTNDATSIGPNQWEETKLKLINQFQHPSYFKVEGRPLFLIYNGNNMLNEFKTVKKFDKALGELIYECEQKQLGKPLIGIMNIQISKFKRLKKVDFLSMYNDPYAAYRLKNINKIITQYDQEQLREGSVMFWEESVYNVLGKSKFFVPTVTAGWDNRPWSSYNEIENSKATIWYTRPTKEDLKKSVIQANKLNKTINIKNSSNLIFINSWNEYGEGSHISRMASGEFVAMGVKEALEELE